MWGRLAARDGRVTHAVAQGASFGRAAGVCVHACMRYVLMQLGAASVAQSIGQQCGQDGVSGECGGEGRSLVCKAHRVVAPLVMSGHTPSLPGRRDRELRCDQPSGCLSTAGSRCQGGRQQESRGTIQHTVFLSWAFCSLKLTISCCRVSTCNAHRCALCCTRVQQTQSSLSREEHVDAGDQVG